MKQIVGYYVVPPGELWVRFQGGEMRQATEMERGAVMNAPGFARPVDWQDPRCRQPQTGSVQRFRASPVH